MKPQAKIYIALAAAAIFAIGILGGSVLSNHKITKLEQAVDTAKQNADRSSQAAVEKETEAAEYKQKIEYLEQQLTEIKTIARKQDEELEELNAATRGAHDNVDRARRTRSIAATAAELCKKLAELGHGCDQ